MTTMPPSSLSDAALLAAAMRAAGLERRATADLVALLAEVDARRLYLGQGYSSRFAWCTGVLHLSEPAAYCRITAARAARRYPMILARLADGDVTLTTVALLAAHLTNENHEALLDAVRRKSKRDVERLIASLLPPPDIPSSLRRLPSEVARQSARLLAGQTGTEAPAEPPSAAVGHEGAVAPAIGPQERPLTTAGREECASARRAGAAAAPRAIVAPLASDRYLLRITLSAEARARLDRACDLLRHVVPTGDPAVIIDRALTMLVDQLERSRCAGARRPRAARVARTTGRHVPASVRREVWARDEGRCVFVGADGRCRETGRLELHHVVPFARGGPTSAENLQLRCRAHNAYEAEQEFGARMSMRRCPAPPAMAAPSGQSP
jgi:5-methylcytosine-specific restriction endonuclease McrA